MSGGVAFFVKRLRNFASRNEIDFLQWDEHGLVGVAQEIVADFRKDDGAENQIIQKAFMTLANWNPHFRPEKKIMISFLKGVQESIFCEDFDDDLDEVKIWQLEEPKETKNMLQKRRTLSDEQLAQKIQNEYDVISQKQNFENELAGSWNTVSPKRNRHYGHEKPKEKIPQEDQALIDNAVNLQTLFPHIDYEKLLGLLKENNNNIDTVASIVIDLPAENPYADSQKNIFEKGGETASPNTYDDFLRQLDQIENSSSTNSLLLNRPLKKPSQKGSRKKYTPLQF